MFYEAILGVQFDRHELGTDRVILRASTGSGPIVQLCPNSIAKVKTSSNSIQLRFKVDQVATAIEAAVKNGGAVLQQPTEADGKAVGSIRDPDGYSIALIEK